MFGEELIAGKVAARNAGKILMKYFSDTDKQVKYKSANNITFPPKKKVNSVGWWPAPSSVDIVS